MGFKLWKTFHLELKKIKFLDCWVIFNLYFWSLKKSIKIIGPNGAGKSTTFNILTTLIPKSSGHISIKNQELNSRKLDIFKDVAVCP